MKMNYMVLGTNNMAAAVTFYDQLFADTGITQIAATERMTYWQGEDFAFALAIPFDQQAASAGNGTMVGFSLGSAEKVTELYQRAIKLGGQCEGGPGERGPRFSAYVRDLDNNKLCFFA